MVAGLPRTSVQIAHFEHCSCDKFAAGENHLAVETRVVKLQDTSAVAISYSWGAFDRQQHNLGHYRNDTSKPLLLTLGAERSVQDFANRLVELCSATRQDGDGGGCWLDQVCFPQKDDEESGKTLAEMPLIYQSLPVKVLFPGSLCKCLRKAYDNHEEAKKLLRTVRYSAVRTIVYKKMWQSLHNAIIGRMCLNSNGLCAWHDRVWPLQELLHSRSITLIWADSEVAECCYHLENLKSGSILYGLRKYAQLLYQNFTVDRGVDHEQAINAITATNHMFFGNLRRLGQASLPNDIEDPKQFDVLIVEFLAPFLLGRTMTWLPDEEKEARAQNSGRYLVAYLNALAQARSAATQPRDYVLSVWVDWDEYKIPESFRRLSAHELLLDGLRQLREWKNLYFPTTWPRGLMGYDSNTGDWCGNDTNWEVRSIRDLYGPFKWGEFIKPPEGSRLPLKLHPGDTKSLGEIAVSFDEWAAGLDGKTIADRFHAILFTLDQAIIPRMMEDRGFLDTASSKADNTLVAGTPLERAAQMKYIMLLRKFVSQDLDPGPFSDNRDVIEEAIFQLVCQALHVGVEAARNCGVRVVFSKGSATASTNEGNFKSKIITCIGLMNWQKLSEARLERGQSLTVQLVRRSSQPYCEAILIPNTSPSDYAIRGVWAPLRDGLSICEIRATLTEVDATAFII